MKKEKGFTLVEVIVSFSLMSVVMIYLLKTIAVISTEQTNILTLENYSVYESTVLKKIYKDINNAYNIDVKEENDIDSLFKSGGTSALLSAVSGLDDFELICFLVVK